jgi:hypothetical protein
MACDCALLMQTPHNIYLFMVILQKICHSYSGSEPIKESMGEGVEVKRTLLIPYFGKIKGKQTLLMKELKKIEAERTLLIPELRKVEANKKLKNHRVDRVLGFFSSRLNWDPHPLTHEGGSGPTRSTWMWAKRRWGTGISAGCRCTSL